MPLREYFCKAHGEFEAYAPTCPAGCPASFVKQEIRTAPAIRSGSTKHTDTTIRNLAADYGLTDVKNDKEGGSVMDALRKGDEDFKPKWNRVGKEIAGTLASAGVKPESNYGSYAAGGARSLLAGASITRHRE